MKSPPCCCFLLLLGCLIFLGASIVGGHETAVRTNNEGVVDTTATLVKRVIHSPALVARNSHVERCNSCGKLDCNCLDNIEVRVLPSQRRRGGERRAGLGAPRRSFLAGYIVTAPFDPKSQWGGRGSTGLGKATSGSYRTVGPIISEGLRTHGVEQLGTTGLDKGFLIGGTQGLRGIPSSSGLGSYVLGGTLGFPGFGTHGLRGIPGSSGLGTYVLGGTLGFPGLGTLGLRGIPGLYGLGTYGLGGTLILSGVGTRGLGGTPGFSGIGSRGLGGIVDTNGQGTHVLGGIVDTSGHGTHSLGGIVSMYGHGTHGLGGLVTSSGHGTYGLGGLITSSGIANGVTVGGTHGLAGINGHSKGVIGVRGYPGSSGVMSRPITNANLGKSLVRVRSHPATIIRAGHNRTHRSASSH